MEMIFFFFFLVGRDERIFWDFPRDLSAGHDGPATAPALRLRRSLGLLVLPPLASHFPSLHLQPSHSVSFSLSFSFSRSLLPTPTIHFSSFSPTVSIQNILLSVFPFPVDPSNRLISSSSFLIPLFLFFLHFYFFLILTLFLFFTFLDLLFFFHFDFSSIIYILFLFIC